MPLELVAQVDLLGAAEPPPRTPVPDEARPSITLFNGAGEHRERRCWSGNLRHFPAFDQVYRALLDLEPKR